MNPYITTELVEKIFNVMSPDRGLWFKIMNRSVPKEYRTVRTQAYLALYGYHSDKEMPDDPLLMVHEDDRDAVEKLLIDTIRRKVNGGELTFRIRTAKGQEKWVHTVVKRFTIEADDERLGERYLDIFASLHTDVSELREQRRFYSAVLDALPGFVYVKEVLSPERIVFRYVNRRLSDIFELKAPSDAIGKTDRDVIPNFPERDELIARFETADREVVDKLETVHIPEEALPRLVGGQLEWVSLATVKTPLITTMFDPDRIPRTYVLGISIESGVWTSQLKAQNELLKEIISQSKDAIYIKEKDGRYLMTNPTFLSLIQRSPEESVVGQTFEQAILGNPLIYARRSNQEIRRLLSEVCEEDMRLHQSSSIMRPEIAIRRALDGRFWETTKKLIEPGHHILGIARDVHEKISNTLIFPRMPQCICIKNHEFEVVWCNQRYAERHGRAVSEMVGLTDYGLWPELDYPGQAALYRRADEEVLRIFRISNAIADKEEAEEFLKRELARYTEYNEEQLTPAGRRMLQTSKWPVVYGGAEYIVVVYSDVTGSLTDLNTFHRFTVHSFRNELALVLAVDSELESMIKTPRGRVPGSPIKALRFLRSALGGLQFYTEHLGKFLSGEISKDNFGPIPLRDITSRVEERIADIASDYCQVESIVPKELASIQVKGDSPFLFAVFLELVNNATKFVREGLALSRRSGIGDPNGRITVRVFDVESDVKMIGISISDNGIASRDSESRTRLEHFFDLSKRRDGGRNSNLGLSFCAWVIDEHEGSFELERYSEITEFSICLPVFVA